MNYKVCMWRYDETDIGNIWAGGVPNLKGGFSVFFARYDNTDGIGDCWGTHELNNSATAVLYRTASSGSNAGKHYNIQFNASGYNGIYSDTHDAVYPRNIKMYQIVKY